MSVTIEQDLKEYLAQQFKQIELRFQQIDQRFEQIDKRFEQVDKRFEKIEARLEKIEGNMTELKVGQARLEGEIKRIEQSLGAKIDALDKRLEFQEFINRGILIGFLAAILAGLAKLFGVIPSA
ncbi:MAG: DUF4164 domain-containing protein [Geminocystis sp.]|nr:DUF4164 domain-containing protein [Geminocystis sp.]MDW8117113.1 DUF4164 domain-containing protein [Geminocystis sp.]MDW8462183.1 DUF4164 domain-containing protein [Geminocystis sp.]